MLKYLKVIFLLLLFTFCSNENNVDNSKDKKLNEIKHINDEKRELYESVDSLNEKIKFLKDRKTEIKENLEFYEVEIFEQIKNAKLDHVIIGTVNLQETSSLFNKLGFSIKDGYKHKNGINNNFIEFTNNSEIELIEINKPIDLIATEYNELIVKNTFGLQFAFRVTEIERLKESFKYLNLPFTQFENKSVYKTLSSNKINAELPLFFIEFTGDNNNILTSHSNKSKAIKSVWFETKDIKKTARQLVDFGFNAIGNYYLPKFTGKVVQFKNNNFEIILIESQKYVFSGISISVENKKDILEIINKDFSNNIIEKEKSIFLTQEITKSIWIEFLEE
jgi:hypothetical protein